MEFNERSADTIFEGTWYEEETNSRWHHECRNVTGPALRAELLHGAAAARGGGGALMPSLKKAGSD